ncbi:helix-turn-helix domain-containing protein [Sphingobacterium sp. UBA6320]|uniref:helix-turn-helix domain-containing protein n=1 Tax=Sphingobacterium sp. UBA6320 TaxID=1947510 RepID=UPI0025CE0C17|nr:helix-turn-helix transcriptional regulator [Sphingobacterium sp. UBA6320]
MDENLITEEARRFKAFRLAEGMTQEEIGEILNLTKSAIGKIEIGIRRISVDHVKLLHQKKSMSYEWFYHGKGNRIHTAKDENLIKVTTDLRNQIELMSQKLDSQDRAIKKIYRDFYNKTD